MRLRLCMSVPILMLPLAAAAANNQNALAPMGPQARHIYDLWIVMLAMCSIVLVAVMVALVMALLKAPRASETTTPLAEPGPVGSKVKQRIVIATVLSVAGLMGLLVASIVTDRALASLPTKEAVELTITAHQWWWEVRYDDASPDRVFSTANEIHVPVGRPVIATLKADDVIHSFWVPNLHGKKDMIPGRDSSIHFEAERAGVYRGQCAEFCGYQHAWMALLVIAEPPDEFDRWKSAQLASAPEPTVSSASRGKQIFESSTCSMCHAIAGTQASARMAPDLTHVASRRTLAAGTLPNTVENLSAWIANPQSIKPGVNMPAAQLPQPDLEALVAYLGTLK